MHEDQSPTTPPLTRLQWLPRSRLTANSWNPNRVAPTELDLLVTSLVENNWTQPVVSRAVEDRDGLEIVDGFHRWTVSERDEVAELTAGVRPGENRSTREIELEATLLRLLDALDDDPAGDTSSNVRAEAREQMQRYDVEDEKFAGEILIPVVQLEGCDMATLMMATVRHNRARGSHGVIRMADIVVELAGAGVDEHEIAHRLGMDKEEVVRLKQRGKMTERAAVATGAMSKAWHAEMKDGTEDPK